EALVTLYPAEKDMLDQALADTLASLPSNKRVTRGLNWGKMVADQIVASRANDHADQDPSYTPGNNPGDWQPTPPDFSAAWGPGWMFVTPFGMTSGSQFRPAPPPALDSQAYTDAYNQVKSLGKIDSTTRTADQTEVGHFWGYDIGPMGTPP